MTERAADGSIPVLDHGFVRLDGALADDLSVVNAARVSFARRKTAMDESDAGLVRFLMRERHGCYDDATEVLTHTGWKPWPAVTGEELFATRSRAGQLEYQPALRLVRKEYRGHMIGFNGMSLDMLVTPDHRVLCAPTTAREGRTTPRFGLRSAHSVLWRPHWHVTTAEWRGERLDHFTFDGRRFAARSLLRLIGFFIGDGNLPGSNAVTFNLREEREIAFLRATAGELGLEVRTSGKQLAVPVGPELRGLFALCYVEQEKVVPRLLLELAPDLLDELLHGLIESDGSRLARPGRTDRLTYHTTSKRLADSIQELALKLGRSASVRPHRCEPGDGHLGSKPRWRVSIYAPRTTRPELCRTRQDADSQMGVERYDGAIHCVEVPNGTLYVRRNGYAAFSGNTPFEHNAFRFHVRCPIFVAREWFRHRVGSYNEFSMRYAEAKDEFYVPAAEDVRTQTGKPGAYTFEQVDKELAAATRADLEASYAAAFATYQRLVERGIAREVARAVLPVGIYTEFFWTVNARALMNFLSLRNAETAQREIRRFAEAVEELFGETMPVTHAAFLGNGRAAP